LGMSDPVGHIDFYPNDGQKQPGCKKTLVDQIKEGIIDSGSIITGKESIFDVVACSHMRSIYLYTESINSPCPFYSYRCPNYAAFQQGLCMNCGLNNTKCETMGHHADNFIVKLKPGETNVKMYLTTGAEVPRCRHNYLLEIDLAAGLGLPQDGLFHGDLIGDKSSSGDAVLSKDTQSLAPGTPYRYLMQSEKPIGYPKQVEIWWDYIWSIKNPSTWPHIRKPRLYVLSVMAKTDTSEVSPENGEDAVYFCGHRAQLQPGKQQSTVYFPSTQANGKCV